MLIGFFCSESVLKSAEPENRWQVCFPMLTLADAFAYASLAEEEQSDYFCVYDVPEDKLAKIDAVAYANARFGYIGDMKDNLSRQRSFDLLHFFDDRELPLDTLFNFVTEANDLRIVNYIVDRRELTKFRLRHRFSIDKHFRHLNIDNVFNWHENPFGELFSFVCEAVKRLDPAYRIFDLRDVHVDGLQFSWYPAGVLYTKRYAFLFLKFAVVFDFVCSPFGAGVRKKDFVTGQKIKVDLVGFREIMNRYFEKTERGALAEDEYLEIYQSLTRFCGCNF